jgi:hypothetical protein
MNLKLFVALLCAGIAVLVGSTAFVATLPASQTAARATHHTTSTTGSHRETGGTLPHGWTFGHPTTSPRAVDGGSARTKTSMTPTTGTPTSTTQPASPPTTAFVLVTISYTVNKGDTLASIEKWFDEHGYGAQFAANLQVIDDNLNLLVPGAVISISNGVMTIHSPI